MSKTIAFPDIQAAVARLAIEANRGLPDDVARAMTAAQAGEQSTPARATLSELIANQAVARDLALPLCQDTGTAVVFVELGQEARIRGRPADGRDSGRCGPGL